MADSCAWYSPYWHYENEPETRKALDHGILAARLQEEGAISFAKSWNELMAVIASKGVALEKASIAGTNLQSTRGSDSRLSGSAQKLLSKVLNPNRGWEFSATFKICV